WGRQRHAPGMFRVDGTVVGAAVVRGIDDRLQVRDFPPAAPGILGSLSAAAAVGAVDGIDRPAVVERHDARRGCDGLADALLDLSDARIAVTMRGVAEVELRPVAAAVALGVGAGGDGERLE